MINNGCGAFRSHLLGHAVEQLFQPDVFRRFVRFALYTLKNAG